MISDFLLGLDLGQRHDYSALAILERRRDGDAPAMYDIRHLRRFALGTPYQDIVDHVALRVRDPQLRGRAQVAVDVTGVGATVGELLDRAGLDPVKVMIHGGASTSRDEAGVWHVPKRELIGILHTILDGRLRMPKQLPEAQIFLTELLAFRQKITISGHDSYEAWRERDHDDTVLAVASAGWVGEILTGSAVFERDFFPHHVSDAALEPEDGWPLIRAWRTIDPPCCVVFQHLRGGQYLVLEEVPPQAGADLRRVGETVRMRCQIRFPGWSYLDLGIVEQLPLVPGRGTRRSSDALRPEIAVTPGECDLAKQVAATRMVMSRMVQGRPALQIDQHTCPRLIRALASGCRWRRLHGALLPELDVSPAAWLVEAWMSALAVRGSGGDRRAMRGPSGPLIPM